MLRESKKNHVKAYTNQSVLDLQMKDNDWQVTTKDQVLMADYVVFATGSSSRSLKIVSQLGHNIVKEVPSLFTFNVKNPLLKDLMGVSFSMATVKIPSMKLEESAPLLITHWGLSGPAILKLSAWGARLMAEKKYQFEIEVNFIQQEKEEAIFSILEFRKAHPKKNLFTSKIFDITNRFWHQCLNIVGVSESKNNADLTKKEIESVAEILCKTKLQVNGRSVFKEEFVTAGGVDLKEMNFKTMESKLLPGLFIAGEALDIDAVTGGFNFQACWSEAWIIADTLNQK